MDTLCRAAAAIRRAEDELRGLLTEAAEAAQYEEVLVLGEWARQLRGLLSGPVTDHSNSGNDMTSPITEADGAGGGAPTIVPKRVGEAEAAAIVRTGNGRSPASATKRTQLKQRRKGGAKTSSRTIPQATAYPRFLRDGNHLIKIGWSKKEKAQYEHKAPKAVLHLLLASLIAAGREGHRFTTDDVLPLREASDGAEVPSYQAYLCLAWLRSEGLIEQHGRQGYSLPNPDLLTASLEKCWERLARR